MGDLVDRLAALPGSEDQRRLLEQELPALDAASRRQLADQLKEACIRLLRSDAEAANRVALLVGALAELTSDKADRALSLRLQAMVATLAFGRHEESLQLYEDALTLYRALDDDLGQALVQVTRIWPLSHVAGYEPAVAAAEWAAPVLRKHGRWRDLANLQNNLAPIHNRYGRFEAALQSLDTAHAAYLSLGPAGEAFLANNLSNRAFVLYVLGRFRESIAASEEALRLAERNEQRIVLARARQNLGLTHFALGRYNLALALLDQATETWRADGRLAEVVQAELTATYCLLELRRYQDVLQRFRLVHELIDQHHIVPETPFSLLNEARAYGAKNDYAKALNALDRARRVIQQEASPWDLAQADLAEAFLRFRQADFAAAGSRAQSCAEAFATLGSPLDAAAAYLLAARAAFADGRTDSAGDLLQATLRQIVDRQASALLCQANILRGRLAEAAADRDSALHFYRTALEHLEQVQAHVISEYRPDFLADMEYLSLYENLVAISLESGRFEAALDYVERAKSRALLQLFHLRRQDRLAALGAGDEPLVAAVNRLRAERNTLLRAQSRSDALPAQAGAPAEQLADLEQQLTAAWRRLLVRNAAYAGEASLERIYTAPAAPQLDSDTLLLEYFVLDGRYLLFLVAHPDDPGATSEVVRLEAAVSTVFGLLNALQLNMRLIPGGDPARILRLLPNAQGVLNRLWQLLLQPVAARLARFRRLLIVPHGDLHYLPFHALFDGRQYQVETHSIAYLPASSLLSMLGDDHGGELRGLSAGYTLAGRLPNAVAEARDVLASWPHAQLIESEFTQPALQAHLAGCRILHLATHGEFRPDEPLFSGLAMADGWLSTLDVFELPLQASLVTLSACETGRHVIGGGDEILGLTRAFLAAGAASLLISHWAVEDISTRLLMRRFYDLLAAGSRKDDALSEAQRAFIAGSDQPFYAHPYFWAPFYLMGAAGCL